VLAAAGRTRWRYPKYAIPETFAEDLHYAAMHNLPAVRFSRGAAMSEARMTLMEAIARKQAVTARYNGDEIKLAPHLLFERRGDLFLQALNMGKAWRTDEERRLGQFKLAGLIGTKLLDEAFAPLPHYDAVLPHPDDALILTV
jgi:hypothetical protein